MAKFKKFVPKENDKKVILAMFQSGLPMRRMQAQTKYTSNMINVTRRAIVEEGRITEAEIKEAYVVIHTKEMTDEIVGLAKDITEYTAGGKIIGNSEDKMIILEADTISVIRVDNEKVYVVSEGETYRVGKRMYELLEILGKDFMQVSKSASINLKYLKSVEPYFNGVMVLNLKDGEKEYISRKYVPALKKYLGL